MRMEKESFENRAIYKKQSPHPIMKGYHRHAGFEVFQIWSEGVTVLVDDKIFSAVQGDVYFLDSNSLHWVKSSDGCEYIRSAITFPITALEPDEIELVEIFKKPWDTSCMVKNSSKKSKERYDSYFREYTKEMHGKALYSQKRLHAILVELLVELNRDISGEGEKTDKQLPLHGDYIQKTLYYISRNIKHKISIEAIASHLSLDKHYLCRLFKQATGITIQKYITERKMYIAKDILKKTQLSIEEVAYQMGYSGYSSFSQAYKRIFGVSPQKQRKNLT